MWTVKALWDWEEKTCSRERCHSNKYKLILAPRMVTAKFSFFDYLKLGLSRVRFDIDKAV